MRTTISPAALARRFVAFAVMFVCGACHELTRVTEPGVLQPSGNNDSTGAVLRRAGAISAFESAFSAQAAYSGMITDELAATGGQNPLEADERIADPNTGSGYPYDLLSTARVNALRAIVSLRQFAPALRPQIGELFAYVGYVELFFAEDMCNGVPLGVVSVSGALSNGQPLTRGQMITQAISNFDTAAAEATGNDSIVAFASVGKARALLDSGDVAAASAAAATVSPTYTYMINLGPANAGPYNVVNYFTWQGGGAFGVGDREGANGLDFVSATDPRVPTTPGALGAALPNADSSYTSPILLASGVDAALMQAEASLTAGDVPGWASSLNALRMSFPDTALSNHPLPADSTTGAAPQLRVDVMFRERAFWLFLTGHRQGDMRRLIRQYGRSTESVFPTGPFHGGPAQYGSAVVFEPFGEQANPYFHGCLDLHP